MKYVPEFLKAQFSDKSASGPIMRNMAVLASGTAGAQAIGFLLTPVITRIYTPADYGILAIFATVIALVVPLVTLRYAITIPLPKHTGLAVNLLVLCLSLAVFISLFVGLVFWLLGDWIFSFFNMPELAPYWWLLSLGVLGYGLYETFNFWATREKQFKILAKTKMTQTTASSAVQIGLGLLAFQPFGLLLGHVVKQAAGFFSIFYRSRKQIMEGLKWVKKTRILFLVKWYSNFPKYQIGSRFLYSLSDKAPLFFMATLFDAETTGQLGLSLMVLAVPMRLVGRSVGHAYFAEVAEIGSKNPEKIEKITKSITKKLFAMSTVPFLVLLLAGPWLFSFVFGQEWNEAGWFASMLSISLLSQFISSPIVNTLSVFRREDYYLRLNLVRITLISSAFGLSYILGLNALYTVLIYSIFITLHRFFVYGRILKMIKDA